MAADNPINEQETSWSSLGFITDNMKRNFVIGSIALFLIEGVAINAYKDKKLDEAMIVCNEEKVKQNEYIKELVTTNQEIKTAAEEKISQLSSEYNMFVQEQLKIMQGARGDIRNLQKQIGN